MSLQPKAGSKMLSKQTPTCTLLATGNQADVLATRHCVCDRQGQVLTLLHPSVQQLLQLRAFINAVILRRATVLAIGVAAEVLPSFASILGKNKAAYEATAVPRMLKAHEAYPEPNQQRILHGVALRDEGAAGRRRRIELRGSVLHLWSASNRIQ